MATAATASAVPPPQGPAFIATPAALPPPGQPDIAYHPDWEKYQARATRRAKLENLPKTLPDDFPAELKGSLVWEGATLAQSYDWTYVLSADQLKEIDDALAHFKCEYARDTDTCCFCLPATTDRCNPPDTTLCISPARVSLDGLSANTPSTNVALGLPLGHVSAETFPLPSLRAELRRLSAELHTGHGFFVLRGLQVDQHTREENIIIYTGVSSHVAAVRGRQDAKYQGVPADVVVTHIKNLTVSDPERKSEIGSPAYTADKQVFHTDAGDIVSLFALETAGEGGASRLASTWRVYNYLAANRPDLIQTLSQSWDVEKCVSLLLARSCECELMTGTASPRRKGAATGSPAGR